MLTAGYLELDKFLLAPDISQLHNMFLTACGNVYLFAAQCFASHEIMWLPSLNVWPAFPILEPPFPSYF